MTTVTTNAEHAQKDLKDINLTLYNTLMSLFLSHVNNGGEIKFSEKNYSYISDDLDQIEINYFGQAPDGDSQETLFRARGDNNDELMNDIEAYELLVCRLNNTEILD